MALTTAILLAGVLLAAAGLRLAGLNWDGGHYVHPDERRILLVIQDLHWPRPWDWSLVLSPRSPLNPHFFAYGSLPIYLLRLVAWVSGLDSGRLLLAGRALSALFDLLTLLVIYLAGRELGGRRVGLVAGALYSVAVLAIQLAHFITVDSLLTLLCALTVYCLLRLVRGGSPRAGLAAGVCMGLALATKTSALPLAFVIWAAWAIWALAGRGVPRLGIAFLGLSLTLIGAAGAFLLAEPYSVLDWFRFAAAIVQEGSMAQGWRDLPYTRQYIGTVPYLYPVRELLLSSLGLPLGLLALAGILWLTWRGIRRRRPGDLIVLAWFWPSFLATGSFHAKFPRYMAPLIPWLCLAAALLLQRLWQVGKGRQGLRRLAVGVAGGVLLSTGLYALAFTGLYLRPHPWLAASDWLCQRAPQGAVLAVEVWDDPLPVGGLGGCRGQYQHLWLDLYAPDDENKLAGLAETLSRADYVVLASQRLYGSIGRLPQRYPLTNAYYRLLFAERLGFRLAAVEDNYPRLGPVALVDEPLAGIPWPRPALLAGDKLAPLVLNLGRIDESLTVYDHPRVLIFEKQARLAPGELRAILASEAPSIMR